MIVGIPKERFVDESRIALDPAGVRTLVEAGATVYVEQNAGYKAGWNDSEFESAGATIAYSAEELFRRADFLLKVLPPSAEESDMLQEGTVLMSYLQLPLTRQKVFNILREKKVTAVALENIQNETGHPVRRAMSEIAGALAVEVATAYLGADLNGRGVLIGGVPGVPPANIGIIGAGVVGKTAAEVALGMGASVILVDSHVDPLREARQRLGTCLQTAVLNRHNIDKLCRFVDVLIGAVLIEDYPTPHIVGREQLRMMKPRSVIVDIAIDQGGFVETSRPTTLSAPTFVEEGIIHYCVPNIPAKVPRTATRAFMNQVLPLAVKVVQNGAKKALQEHPYMVSGLNMIEGTVTREAIARTFNCEWIKASEVLN